MNLKKILLLLLIALFFGFIIFKHYKAEDKNYKEIYIVQVGAYKDYDNVAKITKYFENYIIYEEGGLYKVFIGLASSDDVYNKIINTYAKDLNVFKKVLKVTNQEFERKVNEYDELIKVTNKKDNLNIIIKEELKLLNKILSNS